MVTALLIASPGRVCLAASHLWGGNKNEHDPVYCGGLNRGLGTQQSVDVFGFSGPGAFGSEESFTDVTSSSGTAIGFNTTGPVFFISRNYVSNTAISSSALFSGKTLASLGLSAGTYDYTPGQNKISLVIGQTVAAVPEPATWAMMILGFASSAQPYAARGVPPRKWRNLSRQRGGVPVVRILSGPTPLIERADQ